MQTFLPYSDFKQTAKCLDMKRLGKQRVEVWQILLNLSGEKPNWQYHPIMAMWRGSEGILAQYGLAICDEWIRRGYKDTMRARIDNFACLSSKLPVWYGDENIYRHYRQTLLFKNYEWYSQFGWKENPVYGYIWPINI
jgi:hypothetical protein